MDGYGTSTRKSLLIGVGTVALTLAYVWAVGAADEGGGGYGLGRAATDEEIRAWNIDVSPTGEGLPPGQGTAKQGAQVFAAKCAMCHGPTGKEGQKDRLVGGQGTLTQGKRITVLSMSQAGIRYRRRWGGLRLLPNRVGSAYLHASILPVMRRKLDSRCVQHNY